MVFRSAENTENVVEDLPMIIHGQFGFNCPSGLVLIIFVVFEKKAFEHFPIGSNINLCPVVAVILDF